MKNIPYPLLSNKSNSRTRRPSLSSSDDEEEEEYIQRRYSPSIRKSPEFTWSNELAREMASPSPKKRREDTDDPRFILRQPEEYRVELKRFDDIKEVSATEYEEQVQEYLNNILVINERIRSVSGAKDPLAIHTNLFREYWLHVHPLSFPEYSNYLESIGPDVYQKALDEANDYFKYVKGVTIPSVTGLDTKKYIVDKQKTNLFIRFNVKYRTMISYTTDAYLDYLTFKYKEITSVKIMPFLYYYDRQVLNTQSDDTIRQNILRYQQFLDTTLRNKSVHMIVIPMGIINHATVAIIHPKKKQVFLYETNGTRLYAGSHGKEILRQTSEALSQYQPLQSFQFMDLYTSNNRRNIQALDSTATRLQLDADGYCMAFMWLYVDYRLFFIDEGEKQVADIITNDLQDIFQEDSERMLRLIRDYYIFINKAAIPIYKHVRQNRIKK